MEGFYDSEVKWGGARKGAGRKRKMHPPAERKNYSVYMSEEEREQVKKFLKGIREHGYRQQKKQDFSCFFRPCHGLKSCFVLRGVDTTKNNY